MALEQCEEQYRVVQDRARLRSEQAQRLAARCAFWGSDYDESPDGLERSLTWSELKMDMITTRNDSCLRRETLVLLNQTTL